MRKEKQKFSGENQARITSLARREFLGESKRLTEARGYRATFNGFSVLVNDAGIEH